MNLSHLIHPLQSANLSKSERVNLSRYQWKKGIFWPNAVFFSGENTRKGHLGCLSSRENVMKCFIGSLFSEENIIKSLYSMGKRWVPLRCPTSGESSLKVINCHKVPPKMFCQRKHDAVPLGCHSGWENVMRCHKSWVVFFNYKFKSFIFE